MDPGNQAGLTASSHERAMGPGNQAGSTASSDDFEAPADPVQVCEAITYLTQVNLTAKIDEADQRNQMKLDEANRRHQLELRELQQEVRQLAAARDEDNRRMRELQQEVRQLAAARYEDNQQHQRELGQMTFEAAAVRERQALHVAQLTTTSAAMAAVADTLRELAPAAARTSENFRELIQHFSELARGLLQPRYE